jgi:hypothetical protein
MKIGRVFVLGSLWLLSGSFALHPLKMSYTAVRFFPEGGGEITFRIFQDDFEVGMAERFGYAPDILSFRSDTATISLFTGYLDEMFDLEINGIEYCMSYSGMTPEAQLGLVITYELSWSGDEEIREIAVKNSILTHPFPNQVNMFFIDIPEVLRTSCKFDEEQQAMVWLLNNN